MFIAAKKGTRTSDSKVYISKKAKTISFSAGFLRDNNINLKDTKYVRLAFDSDGNKIAVDFSKEKIGDGESLKLTPTKSKTAASCSVNPILNTFSISITDISGSYTYGNNAIDGPIKINGFSENGYILRSKNREK